MNDRTPTRIDIIDVRNLLDKHFAFLMLCIKEVHILLAAVYAEITCDIKNVLSFALNSYRDVKRQHLQQNNIVFLTTNGHS